ncbi:MAG: acyl-CoA dehydrogenase family protein [Desulfobacteraceae bacterium]|jgi:alkylation response protein AidB-like acyl-CoA dehydrogenase
MNILNYTDEHQAFRKRLREFIATQVVPNAKQWETDHFVPREVWRKMGEGGFLCTGVSKEYGGMGGDFVYSSIVCEEMASSMQTGLAPTLHSDVVVPYITEYGSEAQKKKYLPRCVSGEIITAIAMTEPDAGSDLTSMRTTAVEQGDHVIISGSKTFISCGIHCDLAVVAARNPEIDDPYMGMSLYLLEADTPGFEKGKKLDKMGWNSQDTAELFFNNCKIPIENRLGDKGMGFLMLMGKLQQERLCCSMGAVYGAEMCVNGLMDYCKRTTDASDKPLSKFQAIQFALVEMATEVKLGRTFLDKLIADHMEGLDVKVETSMAKYWTTEMANRVLGKSLEIMGEFGTYENNPLVQGWRDMRVTSIFAGTNEIMKYIISKLMRL